MTDKATRRKIHDLDATLRVGKAGVAAVSDELASQLKHAELVKVKFLRAARGDTTSEELATELADAAGVELIETRGNTAVYRR